MPNAADRDAEPLGDVAQGQVLEAGQLQRPTLPLGQPGKTGAQDPPLLVPAERLPCLPDGGVRGLQGFTRVRRPASERRFPAQRPMVGVLQQPQSDGSARRIVEVRLSIDFQENLLRDIFGFGPVAEDSGGNPEDQPGVPAEERFERVAALVAHVSHELDVGPAPGPIGVNTDRCYDHAQVPFVGGSPAHAECGTQQRVARKKPSADEPKPKSAVLRPLGAQLRRLRHDRKMSQERLAELADTNYKYIGRIELGKVNPGADLLVRLAHALGVSVGELFETLTPTGEPPAWPAADVAAVRDALRSLTDALDCLLTYQPRAAAVRPPRRPTR